MKSLHLFLYSFLVLLSSSLTGCASITNGTTEKINIQTTPVAGASCYLKNDKGTWYLPATPGIVQVHRSNQPLEITAVKSGYQSNTIKIYSNVNGVTVGNVLVGGIIGIGVDCADGAAYNYPKNINVPLQGNADK